MTPTAESVLACLRGARFPLEDEKALQAAMQQRLQAHGFPFHREMAIGNGIIDFYVDVEVPFDPHCDTGWFTCAGVGIEVKIKGSKRDIFRQLCGYCEDERLAELIVATSLPLQLPPEINGKPVAIVDLGRAWL